MAENREEVLSQLYALRAGMSYISAEVVPLEEREEHNAEAIKKMRDKVFLETYGFFYDVKEKGDSVVRKNAEQRKKDFEKYVDFFINEEGVRNIGEARRRAVEMQYDGVHDSDIPTSYRFCEGLNDEKYVSPEYDVCEMTCIPETVKFYQDKLKKCKRCVNELSQKQKAKTFSKNIPLYLFPIFLIAAIIGGVADIGGLMIAGIAGAVISAICAIIYIIRARTFNSDLEMDIARATELLENREELLVYFKKRQANIDDLNKQIKKLEKDEEGKALQAEVYEAVEPVRSALVQTYSGIIDERDWQYLDLVIFYYETRRADSIKEALQLVDRQKQTEMIVSAVQEAGREICSSIYDAAQMLASTIVRCCNIICKNMNANAAAVVDALTLQNSLLEEANRTSAQMADDIKFIKSKMPKRRIASSKSAD